MNRLQLISFGFAALGAAALPAQGCILVADIHPTPGQSSFPAGLASCGGNSIYLEADDGVTGDELWKLDASGASFVKDINPGTANSDPDEFVSCWIGGSLVTLFAATDAVHGRELWVTDGTAAGTTLVKDLYPGTWGSSPDAFTCCRNRVFFRAEDGTHGVELWVSDGTAAGTVLLMDFDPGLPSSWPSEFVQCGGTLYFTTDDNVNGSELWKSDGTVAGTVMVKDIYPGARGGSPFGLLCIGDRIVFSADGGNGSELWISDGTAAGTFEVKDIRPGVVSSGPRHFARGGDFVYFSANDGVNGNELWRSDLTASGTVMVKDIQPGSFGSSPEHLVWSRGQLFFAATVSFSAGGNGTELWVSDGTAANTVEVADISPGSASSSPSQLIGVGEGVYFRAFEPTTGLELWFSDGTAAGTFQACDIHPGSGYSSPSSLTICSGVLYFTAFEPSVGTEIWISTAIGGTVERLGQGCGPTFPTLDATHPLVGATIDFVGDGAPPGQVGPLFMGLPAAPYTIPFGIFGPGCTGWLQLAAPPVLNVSTTVSWNAQVVVPMDPGLAGFQIVCQTLYLANPFPITTDNGVKLTVGL